LFPLNASGVPVFTYPYKSKAYAENLGAAYDNCKKFRFFMCPGVNFLDAFKKECAAGIIRIVKQANWAKKNRGRSRGFAWC
jgi:hypothetical protein